MQQPRSLHKCSRLERCGAYPVSVSWSAVTCIALAAFTAESHTSLCFWQMSALREGQSDLMEAYVKEESKDDLEIDPEM